MTLVLAFLAVLLRPVPGSAQTVLSGDEGQVFALVNATRADHGLRPLARSAPLDEIARAQSRRMVDAQDLFHNPDLAGDLNATGLDWLFTGENVGVGPNVVEIHEAFVASLHHYENIVRAAFDQIGVGVLSKPGGGIYVTHVFAQLGPAPTPAPPVSAAPAATTRPEPPGPPPPLATPIPAPRQPSPIAIEGGIVIPGPVFVHVLRPAS